MEQARAHWKEFLPNRYKEFEEAGILDKALMTAATLTARDMDAFQGAGLSWDEAWERTRGEYLFLPEEPGAKKAKPSPNVAARTFVETARFQSELLQKIKNGE